MVTKRILITAGPTWVPIDSVRVISNIASGETGRILAEELVRLGNQVTLLLGPVSSCCLSKKIKLIHFKFFDELKNKLAKELKSKKYDIVVHTAAVSDYRPKKYFSNKIKSSLKSWSLTLAPTIKIIDNIKKINPNLFVVGFKFNPAVNKKQLIAEANRLLKRAKIDLVVANRIDKNRYEAYIIRKDKISALFKSKYSLVDNLAKYLKSV